MFIIIVEDIQQLQQLQQLRMSKIHQPSTKQRVLQNPFHPLDLSAHDLLTVFKKFDISRQANRNPKHEISIQTVAQLISSLKGCKPSYVQKCMTQALIKPTVSWNDFLAFLDQESQVRQKILDWLIHEKAIIKYRFKGEYPFRQKVEKYYDQITTINCLKLGDDELMVAVVDSKKVCLINLTENKFQQIDSFIQKNGSQKDKVLKIINHVNPTQLKKSMKPIETKTTSQRPNIPCGVKTQIRNGKQRNIMRSLANKSAVKMDFSSYEMRNLNQSDAMLDEETYYKKERKNIHSLFNLFINEQPLENTRFIAGEGAEKIKNRNLTTYDVMSMRDKFGNYTQKKYEMKESRNIQLKPLDKARKKLAALYNEKSKLTYNPHKSYKSGMVIEQEEIPQKNDKKLSYDRKQKEYLLEQSNCIYNDEIKCLAMIFYNLEICLLKVVREYNKIILEEQDSIKLILEKDHKKNQVVEAAEIYFHRITSKWFLLVLFRSEEKSQSKKNLNESCVRGYEIIPIENKRRMDYNYEFANKKQFTIELGKCSMISMLCQPDYGFHLISNLGRYISYKEDYSEGSEKYFKKDYDEKFKNSGVSLTCLAVSGLINKTLLGTNMGTFIIFDQVSRQYRMRKLSNYPILEIKISKDHGYIFCANERIVIFDILRNEQIQMLSVKNQQKLHEKSKRFQLFNNHIISYGTNLRIFEEFNDESLKHEQRKMENMYTWRLNKLKKINKKITMPTFQKEKTNAQIHVASESFFIILTEIHQVIFFSRDSQEVKFSFVLDIPFDSKVMKMIFSPDEKMLGILLFNQYIYVFNVYTQQLLLNIKPNGFQKYTTISFLDQKNEYFLAAGAQNGDIYLIPYSSSSQKSYKVLQYHKRPILLTIVKNDFLISAAEDNSIAIWQLPFNILRRQVKNKYSTVEYISELVGYYLDHICFLRTINGTIIEINLHEGLIKNKFNEYQDWVSCTTDPNMGMLVGVNKNGQVTVLERKSEKQKWVMKQTLNLEMKTDIIGIGIIPCEKAVFFSQVDFCVWPYNKEKPGKIKNFMNSI